MKRNHRVGTSGLSAMLVHSEERPQCLCHQSSRERSSHKHSLCSDKAQVPQAGGMTEMQSVFKISALKLGKAAHAQLPRRGTVTKTLQGSGSQMAFFFCQQLQDSPGLWLASATHGKAEAISSECCSTAQPKSEIPSAQSLISAPSLLWNITYSYLLACIWSLSISSTVRAELTISRVYLSIGTVPGAG